MVLSVVVTVAHIAFLLCFLFACTPVSTYYHRQTLDAIQLTALGIEILGY